MGERGPPPKRSEQRRRGNKPTTRITKAAAAPSSKAPRVNPKWHPIVKRWYQSLSRSGQSQFYQPSDWATAFLLAEVMSRELQPRPVTDKHGEPLLTAAGRPVMVAYPVKAGSLVAWFQAMAVLLVTEGSRRRLAVELTQPKPPAEVGNVAWIDDARRRLGPG